MRPLNISKAQRQVALIRGLRKLAYDCLAQRETFEDAPYYGGEYRQILKTFDRLLLKLTPLNGQRRRLRHLVARWEMFIRALCPLKAEARETKALSEKATLAAAEQLAHKAKSVRVKNLRPFSPYTEALQQRKLERECNRIDRLPCPPGTADPWTLSYRESSHTVAMGHIHTEVQAIRLDFSVRDERNVKLALLHGYLCDSGQRLRYLLASTGLILPSVTFCGTSTRLQKTVGLMLRNVERGSFKVLAREYFPLTTDLEQHSDRCLESVSCRPIHETHWPHPVFSARQHIVLQLLKLVNQNLEELVSREVLLAGLNETRVPSKALRALARLHLRRGHTIPRTSFLEMSLHLRDGELNENGPNMEPESKDLPSYVLAARLPLSSEQRLIAIHLALTVIGKYDNKQRTRVQSQLGRALQKKLQSLRNQLPSEHQEFKGYSRHFAESEIWTQDLGEVQFSETTIWVILERVLAQGGSRENDTLHEGINHMLCQNLMRDEADWFLLNILLSHLQERGTAWKLRQIAKTDPTRLAQILEDFYLRPKAKFYTPLERLAIFCESQGDFGQMFRVKLRRYLPTLPPVSFSPKDAAGAQAEMLRRCRWWTLRGLAKSESKALN